MIERALSLSVPLLIGMFTSLLGLGDLADKVKKIFKKITGRITGAIDGFIEKDGAWFKDKKGRRKERKDKKNQEKDKKKKGDGVDKDKDKDNDNDNNEEDQEYKEKLKKLDLAKKEAINGFNKKLYTVETAVPFLNRIKKKYDLKELYVQQKGKDKAELVGKINPKFEEMLEIIRDDYASGEREPLDQSQQVYSLFRAMKLAELESMRKQKEITVLSHEKNRKKKKKKKAVKKGDPKGQPFLATDSEYSKKLMKRKWELGESKNDEEIKKQYEYLVQIDFVPGTEEVLKDPAIAHFERDDDVSRREFEPLGFKAKEEGKRGFILLKLEPKAEKGKRESVLNYGITPESWNISDPLNITNNQIARIKVIARIVE